jgi:hypothetical protein
MNEQKLRVKIQYSIWNSVRRSVSNFVRYSVWDSVDNFVRYSVWNSVRDSVNRKLENYE